MNKATPSIAIALALAGLTGAAQASLIKFETAFSAAGPLGSAAAYRDTVNEAMTHADHKSADIALFDGINNQNVFGGAPSNIAFRATIDFNAATAGTWGLRAGVDFGRGGAVFLDGVALGFKSTDMWWGGSYANPNQAFIFNNVAIGAGQHRLQLFGLEGCCDGAQQAQFSINGAAYQTFGARDGLVPEPESCALTLIALGGLGLATRRRKSTDSALR